METGKFEAVNARSIGEAAGRPGLSHAGALYSITVLLLLTVGARVQMKELYSGLLITEFVLILVPVLTYLIIFKHNIKGVLRLNRLSFLSGFLILFIMAFAVPVAGVFNLANLWLVNTIFGKTIIVQPPVATTMAGLALSVLVIGVTPGICEEVLFRGVIQKSLDRFGTVKSILATAFLFGLIHLDFQKLFGTFFLGALIGYIVFRTNSLYGGILAHSANNTFAVLMAFSANRFLEMMKASGMEDVSSGVNDAGQLFSIFENMPRMQLVIAIIVWGVIVVFCIACLAVPIYALNAATRKREAAITKNTADTGTGASGMLMFLPGLLLIAFRYIGEGLTLLGIDMPLSEAILKLLGG